MGEEDREVLEGELEFGPALVERMKPLEYLSLMSQRFGARRATELVGWAIVIGSTGLENGPTLRLALRKAGYSQSGFYRALADYRKFGEFVEEKYRAKFSVEELLKMVGRD